MDNWKAVIENYPTSLICEIWFDLQDKQLLGNILFFLLVGSGLIRRMNCYIMNYLIFLIDEF